MPAADQNRVKASCTTDWLWKRSTARESKRRIQIPPPGEINFVAKITTKSPWWPQREAVFYSRPRFRQQSRIVLVDVSSAIATRLKPKQELEPPPALTENGVYAIYARSHRESIVP